MKQHVLNEVGQKKAIFKRKKRGDQWRAVKSQEAETTKVK